MGFGLGRGPNAADEAIEQLVQSPFLKSAKEAYAVDAGLVILSVAPKVSLDQAHQALRQIKGICVDNSLQEGIRVAALLRSVESAEPIEQPEAKTEGEKPNPEPPRKKGGRKPKASDGQMVFVFKEDDLGIFSAKDPTKYFGENLDLPTYSRLNL